MEENTCVTHPEIQPVLIWDVGGLLLLLRLTRKKKKEESKAKKMVGWVDTAPVRLELTTFRSRSICHNSRTL